MFPAAASLLLLAAAEPAPLPRVAAAQPQPALSGMYHVADHKEDGERVNEGMVMIEKLPSGSYLVRWMLRNQPPYLGVGELDEGKFWVAFKAGDGVGIVRYQVSADKEGKAVLIGNRRTREVFTWLRPLSTP